MSYTSHHGLFQFTCPPYRSKTVPGKIPRAMTVLLTIVQWPFPFLYPDGIVIILRSPGECIDNVQKILTLLYDASLTLTLKKCEISTTRPDCLGQFICPGHQNVST